MSLDNAYNFRQQCLHSEKYLSNFFYPYQKTPTKAIPSNLPSYFQREPKIYPAIKNFPDAEKLKIQNIHDTNNDVGLNKAFSTAKNDGTIDLTDDSDVYLESDSGFGGWTPENIN